MTLETATTSTAPTKTPSLAGLSVKLDAAAHRLLTLQPERGTLTVFAGALLISTIVWGVYIFSFLWGNHDTIPLIRGLESAANEGRIFDDLAHALFLHGRFLPIVAPVLDLSMLTAGALLICRLYDLSGLLPRLIICLLITLCPLRVAGFYYSAMLSFFVPYALIPAAFCLIRLSRGILSAAAAACLICVALGMYVVSLNLVLVLFAFTAVHVLCASPRLPEKAALRFLLRLAAVICSGCVLYLAQLYLTELTGIVQQRYNTALQTPAGVIANFPGIALNNLLDWYYAQPPFLPAARLSMLILCAAGFIVLLRKCFGSSPAAALLKLTVLALTCLYCLFFHNAIAFVTPEAWSVTGEWNGRAVFYTLGVLPALLALPLLAHPRPALRLTGLLLSVCTIWLYALSCAQAQSVWKISLQKDLMFRNRVLSRLELQGFDPTKQYFYVQIGNTPAYGRYFMQGYRRGMLELQRPFEVPHTVGHFYYLITDELRPDNFRNIPALPYRNTEAALILCRDQQEWLHHKAKPWPSPDSVLVTNHAVYLILSRSALAETLKRLDGAKAK